MFQPFVVSSQVVPALFRRRLRASPLLLVVFAVLARPALALAQAESGDDAPGEETLRVESEITVTATRAPVPLAEVGSSVTVVTADEIARSGARWVGDVLERVPGVTVARNGGPGTVTSVFLRGANSNHTLVLVDGVKVNTPSTGGYDFAHLPAALVERIEVVRGPQSSLHGSEALGGVIHVITRRGAGPLAGGLSLAGGSYGTGSGQGFLSGASGAWDYSSAFSLDHLEGFSAADERRGNVEPDGYRNLSADGSVGYRLGERAHVQGFARFFHGRTEIDDFAFGTGPVDDPNSLVKSRGAYVGARGTLRLGAWESSLTLGDAESDLESENPDASFTRGSRLDAASRQASWQNRIALGSRNALVAGLDYRRESARSSSVTTAGGSGYDHGVDTLGAYVDHRLSLDRLSLDVGGRVEHHSRFGDEATYRATAAVRPGAGLRLHASVGTAFRGPSLNDLFFPGFGNPDLRPESSTGVDAGLEGRWSRPDLRFDVTAFHDAIEDLIQFSPAARRAENVGEVTTEGVEIAAGWTPHPRLALEAEYTLTRAVDEATGLQLVRRPRRQGSGRLTVRPAEGFRLTTELVAKGERADFGASGRTTLDAFAVVSAAAEIEVGRGWSLTARLDNVLDEEHEEVFGFGTPGRSAYGGIRWGSGGGAR